MRLTPRQLRIVVFMCQGMRRKEIVARLDMNENTYDKVRKQIYAALGVTSEAQIGVLAQRHGWIDYDEQNRIQDRPDERVDRLRYYRSSIRQGAQ